MANLTEERTCISAECKCCEVSLDSSITSRRCFMTGGYCSKQRTVQEERKKLHSKNEINAFMVMNFSDMSNMQYNRKIKKFIEDLKSNLYLSDDRIMCCASPNQENNNTAWRKVSKINVIRADTTYASNFVMCSRVCQQMLIADLVVVDVSIENANVFYELGMAVALGKLILPICSSESYFKKTTPSEEVKKKFKESYRISTKELFSYIGNFPWRKQLFEHYGIRFRNTENSQRFNGNLTESQKHHEDNELRGKITRYIDFEYVKDPALELCDQYLARSPYLDEIQLAVLPEEKSDRGVVRGNIGQAIYERLQRSYNYAGYCDNTVVIYISDGFLNQKQAGLCIINYYNAITKPMQRSGCFCGDRVGVLVQESKIPDNGKDSKRNDSVLYGTSGVFFVAVNEATYKAQQRHIFPRDVQQDMGTYLRDYVHNRAMTIYPDKPVYVKRVRDGRQKEIWGKMAESKCVPEEMDKFICLYHVMLENMRCVQQVVVDITDNSLQSLFWLGAAHGANIYAISVKWERTEEERKELAKEAEKEGEKNTDYLTKQDRHIFDVAGLWTAVLRTNDIDGFYRQIAVAQMDIDQHSKLVLHKNDDQWPVANYLQGKTPEESAQKYLEKLKTQQKEETEQLESYYRDRFWRPMLQYNSLQLYLEHYCGKVPPPKGEDEMQRSYMIKWDVDAAAILSDYLSKRTMIGEYQIESLEEGKHSKYADKTNFLSIGSNVAPFQNTSGEKPATRQLVDEICASLKAYPYDAYGHQNKLWKKSDCKGYFCQGAQTLKCRGFTPLLASSGAKCVFTQTHAPNEIKKEEPKDGTAAPNAIGAGASKAETPNCRLEDAGGETGKYAQSQDILLAQLLLWREVPADENAKILYRVALNGTSGPATKALTYLLVDDEQREKIFSASFLQKRQKDTNEGETGDEVPLLSRLQEEIRGQFKERYTQAFKKELSKISEKPAEELEKIKCCFQEEAEKYLESVLYQYFLPFLSRQDEVRLVHGMRYFLRSYGVASAEKERWDANIDTAKITDTIVTTLEELLTCFRGVEAFYKVKVKSVSMDKESRTIEDICLISKKELPGWEQTPELNNELELNCHFVADGKKRKIVRKSGPSVRWKKLGLSIKSSLLGNMEEQL